MAKGYYKAVEALLVQLGYVRIDGGKGSHEKWRHPETERIQLVPFNLKSRHTANQICKDCGAGKKF